MSGLTVPLGDGLVLVGDPPGFTVEVVSPPECPVLPLGDAVRAALARPLGSPPLAELARGRTDALVVVPDASRPLSPAAALVPILEALAAGGIPRERITVVIGLGLHERPTPDEMAAHVGLAALGGARVVAHDPAGAMADLGAGPDGVPLRISALARDADLLLAFGWVEPHQYAGFSGGFKTVAIGLGSEETIGATHSPAFIDHPRCRPGSLAGNPFQAVLREIGRRAGLAFVVNAIPRGNGVAAAAAGEPGAVLDDLSARAPAIYAVVRGAPADVAIAGVKPPKDRNIYQASRAVTNLVLGAAPAVREGGVLLLPARLPDGCGRGGGERRFESLFREGASAILARRKDRPFAGGEQRAWVLAKVVSTRTVILVGAEDPERFDGLPLGTAATLAEGLSQARKLTGGGRLLVVPDAIGTLAGI